MRRRAWLWLLIWLGWGVVFAESQGGPKYEYFRSGNATDIVTAPEAGFALLGGGKDLDAAFEWLGKRAHGGDFLVLRARGDDDYDPYIEKLAKLNSVATLIVPSREAANDPFVAMAISKAEAIFIAGGDQANYINFWKGTPVQTALNDALRRGVPMGGTSAGLAVLGEYIYSAQNDAPDDPNLSSEMALADPFHKQVVIVRGFLNNPLLAGTITDSHFAVRNRMGRLLVFMARIRATGATTVKGLGVDQGAAVLLEPSGRATVIGQGAAYFLESKGEGEAVQPGRPLSFGPVESRKVEAGGTFDVKSWTGSPEVYSYRVERGVVHSSAANGAIY